MRRHHGIRYCSPIRRHGFSLIEVIVGLAVLALLMAMAAPGLSQLMAKNRATAYADELVSSLNMARTAAIARRTTVQMCTIDATNRCRSSTDPDYLNWDKGWMARSTADDALLAMSHGLGSGARVVSDSGLVEFNADGQLVNTKLRQIWLRMVNCGNKDNRLIEVNTSGSIYSQAISCNS